MSAAAKPVYRTFGPEPIQFRDIIADGMPANAQYGPRAVHLGMGRDDVNRLFHLVLAEQRNSTAGGGANFVALAIPALDGHSVVQGLPAERQEAAINWRWNGTKLVSCPNNQEVAVPSSVVWWASSGVDVRFEDGTRYTCLPCPRRFAVLNVNDGIVLG